MGLPKDCKVDLQNKFPKGKRNLISDVPGVKVGHVTLKDDERFIHTGVTAILPHEGNLFQEKVAAGACVINGFGKSAGLVQIEELGTIETPILMTNTLSVGAGLNGLIQYMLKDNEDIGVSTGTVNCVVTECNDGELNDIRGMHVKEEHVLEALEKAGEDFTEGGVGGGTGMCCMGLKGGIGSASRIITCNEKEYTLGAIVMSNFGVLGNLRIDGKRIKTELPKEEKPEKGSIIIVLGTDIPLNDRQLKRIAKRATVSLARVGSFLGNGSGDIAIAFSNGNRIPHYSKEDVLETKMFHDNAMDKLFDATAEVVEEAIISSMYHAETTKGIRNKVLYGLREFI